MIKKVKKMQAGGVAKPAKRVGPVDPNGAYTKVQERTLAGAKSGAPKLVKDKELGATKMKKGGVIKKAKSGGSFPDLNKDGKVTKADILKGRGVIAKKGAKLKKQAAVAIAKKKAVASKMAPFTQSTMKKGGSIKKCKYGCK